MTVRLNPTENRVIIQPRRAEEVTTKLGIVIPAGSESAQAKKNFGTVVACGPGRIMETGDRIPMAVKVGDEVYFSRYGAEPYKEDGEEYVLMRDTDVVGTF